MRLQGRRIAGGRAQGEALVFAEPLSLLGGLDPEKGIVSSAHAEHGGVPVGGRVLVFPRGKGSTAGSYVLYGLKAGDRTPAALVCQSAEAVVATGAILSDIPMIDQIPVDLLRTGDALRVEADEGLLIVENVQVTPVVTAFLTQGGEILILRRSDRVKTFPGRWAGVSGYLEGDEDPEARARLEIKEETGIREAHRRVIGEVLLARGETDTVWAVHPFLFAVDRREVSLDWEHREHRWIPPEALESYPTVPKLGAALRRVLPVTTPSRDQP